MSFCDYIIQYITIAKIIFFSFGSKKAGFVVAVLFIKSNSIIVTYQPDIISIIFSCFSFMKSICVSCFRMFLREEWSSMLKLRCLEKAVMAT